MHIKTGSCLQSGTRLSCTEGSERGLGSGFNSIETRLIPGMEITCSGTLYGWTVSGTGGQEQGQYVSKAADLEKKQYWSILQDRT